MFRACQVAVCSFKGCLRRVFMDWTVLVHDVVQREEVREGGHLHVQGFPACMACRTDLDELLVFSWVANVQCVAAVCCRHRLCGRPLQVNLLINLVLINPLLCLLCRG